MAKNPKFYVVWKGIETGVFTSWEDCKAETNGFDGAVFKSFESKELAEEAYKNSSQLYVGQQKK
ncbi:viroplasmin family protein [Flavobacterium davisii]|uniref:ribonuclease H1 domain-containing protein n=1 Tax=Flavobacterium davisii TaxID=2906077 RepID=UPI0035D01E52